MAAAVRTVSIAQGVDPRSQTLVGFGGAAGQHICEIAELLGVTRVVDSPEAGLLGALGHGIGRTPTRYSRKRLSKPQRSRLQALADNARAAEEQLFAHFQQQGVSPTDMQAVRWLEIRYAKTEATLTLRWPNTSHLDVPRFIARLIEGFSTLHRQRYGYTQFQEFH